MSRTRAWCFTINNWKEYDYENLILGYMMYTYCIFGFEEGTKEHTPHIQGYIHFEDAKSRKAVSKILLSRAYVTKAKGTAQQNREYCTKQGKWAEYGVMPAQGKRVDIENIRKKILVDNMTVKEVLNTTSVNYQTLCLAEGLMKYQPNEQQRDVKVIWLWGPAGTGKTKQAVEYAIATGEEWWMSSDQLVFWDGYYGQKTVILDELRFDSTSYKNLFRILDRYPYRVNIKGGSCPLKATTIIVTSAMHPSKFMISDEERKQLLRRITEIKEIKSIKNIEKKNILV